MKNWLIVFFVTVISVGAMGQAAVNWNEVTVKDSTGKVYPTLEWQGLLTTGKYGISLSQDQKNAVLVRFSDAEIERRVAALPKPGPSRFFTTGSKITPFNETDINGNSFNLKKLAGKVVVLNFWFVNCPPCRQEMPGLNDMLQSFKDRKDVVFIAIALDPKTSIEPFLKTNPFNYHIIANGGYLAQQYGVTSYPTHVVLDKTGKVTFHTTGLSTATVPWVKRSVDEALVN